MKRKKTSGSSLKPLGPRIVRTTQEERDRLFRKPQRVPYQGQLLDKAIAFLVEKGWTASDAKEQLSAAPRAFDMAGLSLIFEKHGVTWRDLGYSSSEIIDVITDVWVEESERQIVERLYKVASEYNDKFFYGVFADEWLTIVVPFKPDDFRAGAMHVPAKGKTNMIGYDSIWLNPSHLPHDYSEYDFRASDDLLLHEMAHLMWHWITVEGKGNKRYYGKTSKYWLKIVTEWWDTHIQYLNVNTDGHIIHDPLFTAIVNHIGALMGLSAVRTANEEEFKTADFLVNIIEGWSADWPQNVRPKNYYPPLYEMEGWEFGSLDDDEAEQTD